MSEPVTIQFQAGAVGTFVRSFESARDAQDWLENLSDGDIRGEVEAASGWTVKEFTAKRAD